ncbi:cobyric acid synthase [Ferroacidibacillus organovorans]|uniref:Cobyric acid synthase n=1 Tax=Ferroacidibacillus organovorans TaxID=1765683 RepID=A0A1V4EU55_9BACL|nr:cobyric acid synthase [Ferroacidibacillus organovorans]OPG16370.1 cobyric acid synthase CobQ [Ferroacidibacillus organovorans]
MAKCLMVMGTSSNVGKSVLCTALCRILAQDGHRVAPFKSQNMSLNSAVTPSGREIGRAQAVQAAACGIPPSEHMNPVLLKPTSHTASQVILKGRVYETKSARAYFTERTGEIWDAVVESFRELERHYDVLVIEGAGSPVEMNLKPRDIANMRTAELADAAVLLVADIDRGGIFASVVGTMHLLTEEERSRVKGIIVNKFRGDPSLFDDGVRMLEAYVGVPVLGVIPYLHEIGIEEEDSVVLEEGRYRQPQMRQESQTCLRIAILQLPHLSNFTDFDPLFLEPDVHAYFCLHPNEVVDAHVVILPGSKNTVDDLIWLRANGFEGVLKQKHADGAFIVGICGGYQMLGEEIRDPDGQESMIERIAGLRELPIVTTLAREKTTVLVHGQAEGPFASIPITGYEIHMGETVSGVAHQAFARIKTGADGVWREDGAVSSDGLVMGTYLHGIFDNDVFRHAWLEAVRKRVGSDVHTRSNVTMSVHRSQAMDRLASTVREHLDMHVLYKLLHREVDL